MSDEPIVIPAGGGEIVGDSPDRRVEILSDRDELHATWSRFGPGRDGAGPHIHHRHTDLFYVLDGELTVRVGAEDEHVAVAAGTLVRVPPLVVHGFRNASDADVRYLNFHAPGEGFADFMRGLRDGTGVDFDQDEPPADGGRPSSEATIGGGEVVVDEPGRRETLLADVDAIRIVESSAEAGDSSDSVADRPVSFRSTCWRARSRWRSRVASLVPRRGRGCRSRPASRTSVSVPGPEPARFLSVRDARRRAVSLSRR